MTDPPGVQPALGIEAVEWFASGGERLTVRVSGRWLRRPPGARGQPMLVVAADGQRHRFPAMPDPPSLGGTPPGAWRVSFSVPTWLAPHLSRRLSLQMGSVIVPLPGARALADAPQDAQAQSEQRAQTESAARGELEDELPARLRAEADAKLALADLATTEARMRVLEQEIAELRATAVEAQGTQEAESSSSVGPAPDAMRQELEVARGAPAAPSLIPALEPTEPRGLRRELEMLAVRARAPQAAASRAGPSAEEHAEAARQSESLKRALADVRRELEARTESEARLEDTVAALGRELQSRTAIEAEVRAQLARVQGSLESRVSAQAPLEAALGELRAELSERTSADDRDSEDQAAARQQLAARSAALAGQLGDLQMQLAELRGRLAELVSAHDGAEAEVHSLRAQAATLREQLSAAQAASRRDGAALAAAEALLVEAHELAADAGRRLAAEHERAQQAVASRDRVEREFADYRARSARVHGAIEELRGQLAAVRSSHAAPDEPPTAATAQPDAEPSTPAAQPDAEPRTPADASLGGRGAQVQPERLAEALARLRAAAPQEAALSDAEPTETPPAEEAASAQDQQAETETAPAHAEPTRAEPPEPRGAWLKRLLKALVADEPELAGRLVLELLPAQRLAATGPVSYDLVLGERECVQVTVTDAVEIDRTTRARRPADVNFTVEGDRASLARLVVAGRLRARLGRRVAKISGDRRAAARLRALGRAQTGLRELHDAGVRLDADLALRVVSTMIRGSWTGGERFTISHQPAAARGSSVYLQVRDGKPLAVSEVAPLGPVAATIVCPAESLLLLLTGERRADVMLRGDERPLALLQQWLIRAQSG